MNGIPTSSASDRFDSSGTSGSSVTSFANKELPSPLQTLFLWRLLSGDGGEFWKNIKPQISSRERKDLETAGLIVIDKRKESDKKGARPVMYVSLSEAGWGWAAEHLDADFSMRSNAAGPVLRKILGKLKMHLAKTGTSLADFICPANDAGDRREENLVDAIREAYSRASEERWNVRVRLTDLRREMGPVAPERLDEALLAMEREGLLVLYPLDDPQEIQPEDEVAGLPNSLGIRRHIVYIER